MFIVTGFDINIINRHKQKYPLSCAPSAVEMVLKLLYKAGENYYCLQDKWDEMKSMFEQKGNKNFATLQVLEAEDFGNIRFTRICAKAEEIFSRIEEELSSGRYVIISLQNPNSIDFHVWIVYGKNNGDEYIAISKSGSDTIDCNKVKECVKSKGEVETDILVYKIQE